MEDTIVDLTQASSTLDSALDWLVTAVGGRFTTGPRLARAFRERGRIRWRKELATALALVGKGCHSMLELSYARRVERAHRLPTSQRQRRRGAWYDDVSYVDFDTSVELDGRLAHPAQAAFREHRRDNAAVLAGQRVLRYGFADVTQRPCVVAREVAAVLVASGWTGAPRCCGPHCTVG